MPDTPGLHAKSVVPLPVTRKDCTSEKAAFGAILAVAPAAQAQTEYDTMMLANSLGTMIAADERCGLTYEQTAIGDVINENVPGAAMGFASHGRPLGECRFIKTCVTSGPVP